MKDGHFLSAQILHCGNSIYCFWLGKSGVRLLHAHCTRTLRPSLRQGVKYYDTSSHLEFEITITPDFFLYWLKKREGWGRCVYCNIILDSTSRYHIIYIFSQKLKSNLKQTKQKKNKGWRWYHLSTTAKMDIPFW